MNHIIILYPLLIFIDHCRLMSIVIVDQWTSMGSSLHCRSHISQPEASSHFFQLAAVQTHGQLRAMSSIQTSSNRVGAWNSYLGIDHEEGKEGH
jgi:hypothetical protein